MTSELHVAMAAEITELKAKLVKVEEDDAVAIQRMQDAEGAMERLMTERDKLKAECVAMREALETLNNSNMIRRSRLWGCVCDGLAANSAGAKAALKGEAVRARRGEQ